MKPAARIKSNRLHQLTAVLASVLWAGSAAIAAVPAQLIPQTVRITVPAVVEFGINDVSVATDANGITRVSFDLAVLNLGRVLRISVKGEGDMVPPGGPAIPASQVSWNASNAVGGIGLNGVLSMTKYTPVFQGNLLALAGRVDLRWTLASPGSNVQAGIHQLPLRWRIESVIP